MGLKYTNGQFLIAIKTRVSTDGGASWSNSTSLPHIGTGYGSADVSMAFAKNGTLYLSYIDHRENPDSGGVYVTRSHDGGYTWDTPSKAFDILENYPKYPIDRPWIVVDNSNTSNSGTLYITTKPAPWVAPPNRNYYKVSTDSGHTWSALANIDGGTHLIGSAIAAPMATPATTVNGKFCAVYPSYVSSQNLLPAFYMASSIDKGQTFSYNTVYAAIPGSNDTNLKAGYLLLPNPVDSNKLVFLLPSAQNSDEDIFALNSSNGGLNWSNPVRVNDDAIGNGKHQDMVWAAYNETGKLVTTWRDRRASVSGFWGAGYNFYYATSTNNGATFSGNQLLSSQLITFDSLIAQNGNDFMSCVYHADTLFTVWGDTRNGKMNIYFSKTITSTNVSVELHLLNDDANNLKLYPNPAVHALYVELSPELINSEIGIYSASGKKIQTVITKHKSETIDVSMLPSGIYFLKINDQIKKFIKN